MKISYVYCMVLCIVSLQMKTILSAGRTEKRIELLNQSEDLVKVTLNEIPLKEFFYQGADVPLKTESSITAFYKDKVFQITGPADKDLIVALSSNGKIEPQESFAGTPRTLSGFSLTDNVQASELKVSVMPLKEYQKNTSGAAKEKEKKEPIVNDGTLSQDGEKFLKKWSAANFKEAQKTIESYLNQTADSIGFIFRSITPALNSIKFNALVNPILAKAKDQGPSVWAKNTPKLTQEIVNVIYETKASLMEFGAFSKYAQDLLNQFRLIVDKRKVLEQQLKGATTVEEQVKVLAEIVALIPKSFPNFKKMDITAAKVKDFVLK